MPTMTTLVDGTVPVAADFNGNFTALNAAIGSSTAISAWATGEIPYASGANTLSRLTPGSTGQVLTISGGIPAWASGLVGPSAALGLRMKRHATATKVTLEGAVQLAMIDANNAVFVTRNPATFDVDTATSGPAAGGRDQSGAFSNGATVHVYAIRNGATIAGTVSLTGPEAGGPTLPASYTHWCYLATYILVSGSTNFPLHRVRGSRLRYEAGQNVLSNGIATAETAITISGFVPAEPYALDFDIYYRHGTGASTFFLRYVSGSGNYLDENPALDRDGGTITMPNVSQGLYYGQASAVRADVWVLGYTLPNGG